MHAAEAPAGDNRRRLAQRSSRFGCGFRGPNDFVVSRRRRSCNQASRGLVVAHVLLWDFHPPPGRRRGGVFGAAGYRGPAATAAPATDDQGYVDSTARCTPPDVEVAFGNTTTSRVAICKTPGGQYEYRGVRVRDGAKLSFPPPVRRRPIRRRQRRNRLHGNREFFGRQRGPAGAPRRTDGGLPRAGNAQSADGDVNADRAADDDNTHDADGAVTSRSGWQRPLAWRAGEQRTGY